MTSMVALESRKFYALCQWMRRGYPPEGDETYGIYAKRIFLAVWPQFENHLFELLAVCLELDPDVLVSKAYGTLWRGDDPCHGDSDCEELVKSFFEALDRTPVRLAA